MRVLKLLGGIVTAVWALALIPKLIGRISQSDAASNFSYVMGSVVGILFMTAISIALFRSLLRK
jgi:hypothetical protein